MKNFLFLLCICSLSPLFGQSPKGFTIISTGNIVMEESTNFTLMDGKKGEIRKQENIFSISLDDSVFVHTLGYYKKKGEEQKMRSQVYRIVQVTSITNKGGIDLYLLTIESGITGRKYDYYIQYHPKEMRICQIFSMKGSKEKGYKYAGIRYNQLKFSPLIPYQKSNPSVK